MTAEEFTQKYAEVVFWSAISGTLANLIRVPGRRPPRDLVDASAWYIALNEADRAMVRWLIADAAHAAAFGALAMIDGVRPTGPDHYELVAVDADGVRTPVNDQSRNLHDLFQSLVVAQDGTLIVRA